MIINHNMSAVNANRQLGLTSAETTKNMEKLSSGMQINRAADDASGLAVSEKLRGQIRGLNQAEKNIQNGVSFIQTTEGYMEETQSILHRVRELAVQSSNGIYTSEDRMQIQVEISQLVDEVNRVAEHAEFNTMNILTGRFAEGSVTGDVMQFQVGANMDQKESIYIQTMTAQALGLQDEQGVGGILTLSTMDDANRAIGTVDAALEMVSKQRANLGAYQNRFEEAAKGVAIASENMQAAESLIRDTDMASEIVQFTKNQILNQAGNSMLAQANVSSQNALQLLS